MKKAKKQEKECKDKKCPFHGDIKLRGKSFIGVVLAKDTHKTATVEWSYSVLIPKFERREIRRTKVHVHNPECIDADIGDIVKIHETKPLSKTKNFVIVEDLGKKKGFIEELAAREEATVEGAQKAQPKGESAKEKPEEKEEAGTQKNQSESDSSQEKPKGAEE
jgi:small subunit ribosomal protein S17